jgi:cell division protein FtsB
MKKKNILQISFFISLCSLASTYLWKSKQGIFTYLNLKKEHRQETIDVQAIEYKNNELRQKINQWNNDSFEKEKVVRQDLGMSFTNELVYLIREK